MTARRRLVGGLVSAALALVLVPASAATASPTAPGASEQATLAAVRQATARFHSLAAAEDAGYVKFLPCFDLPGTGGMGQHFLLASALDDKVDALQPEVLVYEPKNGAYQLVGVEYVVPRPLWTGAEPPELFGHSFHYNPTLDIWALHAWIWRPNPLGMHEDFNPKVAMCP